MLPVRAAFVQGHIPAPLRGKFGETGGRSFTHSCGSVSVFVFLVTRPFLPQAISAKEVFIAR